MNARLSPLAATSPKALAYRPNLAIHEEAMDDMGLYSETTSARPLLIDALCKLPNERLVDLGWQLRSRLLKGEFTAPDFAVLTALVERIEAAK